MTKKKLQADLNTILELKMLKDVGREVANNVGHTLAFQDRRNLVQALGTIEDVYRKTERSIASNYPDLSAEISPMMAKRM